MVPLIPFPESKPEVIFLIAGVMQTKGAVVLDDCVWECSVATYVWFCEDVVASAAVVFVLCWDKGYPVEGEVVGVVLRVHGFYTLEKVS